MKLKFQTFVLPLFLVVVIFFPSCQQSSSSSENKNTDLVAIDSRGKEVRLPKVADRVVALYESLVDDIFMLGAQDKLVGVPQQLYLNESAFEFFSTKDERFARKEIATPTFAGSNTNVEALVGLKPDLVLTFEHNVEAIEQLETLGIPVFAISSKNKEAIINELVGIATLLGKEERAAEIVDYVNTEVTNMQAFKIDQRKKVYYAWSKGRVLSTSGKGTLMDMAISLGGAQNACPLEMEAPNVGAEILYQWNPDLIILWNSNENDVYSLTELSSLPAVTNKQVRVLEPSINFDPHTVKFLLFAKQVQNWCYPEYTAEALEADVEAALHIFYKQNN